MVWQLVPAAEPVPCPALWSEWRHSHASHALESVRHRQISPRRVCRRPSGSLAARAPGLVHPNAFALLSYPSIACILASKLSVALEGSLETICAVSSMSATYGADEFRRPARKHSGPPEPACAECQRLGDRRR